MDYDFSGWATRNDVKCSDGRTIRHNAFKDCDGATVPLVWNHSHGEPANVLGHALLKNMDNGVYCYGTFNDSENGQLAKTLVQHGDITQLSIYANKLKQISNDVIHGIIREVSLVHAGANPGAYIETVIEHSDNSDEEAVIFFNVDEPLDCLEHSDKKEEKEEVKEEPKKEEKQMAEGKDKTVGEIVDSMTEEQKNAMYYIVGKAVEDAQGGSDDEEDETEMKHNIFEEDDRYENSYLSHAEEGSILDLAKEKSVGSLRSAIKIFAEQGDSRDLNALAHSIDDIETLFPDYKNINPGEPETITRDMGWVGSVINGVHKSPISRIKTRQADARQNGFRARGYKKGEEKKYIGNVKLLGRTTDPQTVYVKDKLERDDIIDITDFDVVRYTYKNMRIALNEELAMAIMVGDGREDGDDNKISEEHIRSIWHDDDLYTIHYDVDIAAARSEIQGTETGQHFGDNYVYAEAIIAAALHSRELYKGSGSLAFYCTPHLLNVMLLARDLNGRRIYNSKADLQAALNVSKIETVEQFEGLTREDSKTHNTKKLLGIFVNLSDYQVGSTKGGEITTFDDFDIDFNQYKYLMETRVSGALIKPYSAIALEEIVNPS